MLRKLIFVKKFLFWFFFSQYEKLKWQAFVWDIVCWIWLKNFWNILLEVPSRVKNLSLYIFFFSAPSPIGRVITHTYLIVFVEHIAIKVGPWWYLKLALQELHKLILKTMMPQTHLMSHDLFAVTTNLFVVTTNLFVVTTKNYKPVCSNCKQVLPIVQTNAFSARKELRASKFTMTRSHGILSQWFCYMHIYKIF